MGGREGLLFPLNAYKAQMSTGIRYLICFSCMFMLDVVLPIWHS
jgi:hypothetical protein